MENLRQVLDTQQAPAASWSSLTSEKTKGHQRCYLMSKQLCPQSTEQTREDSLLCEEHDLRGPGGAGPLWVRSRKAAWPKGVAKMTWN